MSLPDNRLQILDDDEAISLYTYIPFTDEERKLYFALSESERTLLKRQPIKTRIYFILQLGYFKAQKQFFHLTSTRLSLTSFISTKLTTLIMTSIIIRYLLIRLLLSKRSFLISPIPPLWGRGTTRVGIKGFSTG